MSRRKAFDTSLTGGQGQQSKPQPRQQQQLQQQQPKPRQPSFSKADLPPKVTPPHPAVGSATVPTETQEEKEEDAAQTEPVIEEEVDDDDDGVCFICAEPITFWSVGVCGHRTCHVCAIRLRTFYKKTECTFCKTPTPSVSFSRTAHTPFPAQHHITPSSPAVIAAAQAGADKLEKGQKWDRGLTLPGKLNVAAFPFHDEKLGVVFEDEEMMEATLLLLRFNCPYPDCAFMGSNWDDLGRHTNITHGLVLCSLCRRQLSRFAHEQVLYPPHLLALHNPAELKRGQRAPHPRGEKEIEMVKGWEAPHPMCEFCHEAFFGPDELFKHMRERHEECHVCRQVGDKDVYFSDYGALDQHFHSYHHPCLQPSCLEKKFVVFPSEMDLRAHTMAEHGEQMSSRDRASARQIPVDFNTTSNTGRSRRPNHPQPPHQGRGFSLARDQNVQQQQISQPPPMAPAQAAQARRGAQVDRQEEGRRKKAFEVGLTGTAEDRGGSGHVTPREDVDDATLDRHAALLSRVAMLVSDNQNKLNSFRSAVRQFMVNESSAKDLIDSVYNVLDQDREATVGILRDVVGLLDSPADVEKGRNLLEALNGFRIQGRDQFPALATPSAVGSNYAGITSGAILNAKRSTHTQRRGAQSVWERVEAAAAASQSHRPQATVGVNGRHIPGARPTAPSSGAFPTLGAAGPSRTSGQHVTPWSTGGSTSKIQLPPLVQSVRSENFSSGPMKKHTPSTAGFPSLPMGQSSAAERKALFNKPNARDESIRRMKGGNGPPPAVGSSSAWGAAPGDARIEDGMDGLDLGPNEGGGGGGKKKGKGKQLLFAVSARPS